MFSVLRLLYVAILLGIFKITEQKGLPPSKVGQILDYLAQQSSNNKVNQPQRSRDNGFFLGNKHSRAEDIPNLANIQNYFYTHSNLRDDEELESDLEKHLTLEDDRLCRATGRCGCGGGRCGVQHVADDRTVDDIDKLLKDLNENLNKEQDTDNQFEVDALKYDDEDDDDISPTLKSDTFTTKDDLDVIILEVPDSDVKNIISILRNLGDDVQAIDLRNIDLDKLLSNRNIFDDKRKNIQRGLDSVNLQDFDTYFKEDKKEILKTLIEFIKGKKDKKDLYLSELTPLQNKEVSNIKESYLQTPLRDDELNARIVKLIFGPSSNIRKLSQPKDHNIYIPRNMYDSLQSYKKKNNLRVLRGKKSNMLPLTVQQKERIKNKIDKKIIPKHAWRRNMQEKPKYGVPFQLEVQGLGQTN